jgi:four helix bundle protein
MEIRTVKELSVYQLAYELAMEVFQIKKRFPDEEKYALTSQIRRSSRSVCLNLREAWAKRRYEAHFVSKLTDCDGENSETDSAPDFVLACGYIDAKEHGRLTSKCAEIDRMLGSMIKKSKSFGVFEGESDL